MLMGFTGVLLIMSGSVRSDPLSKRLQGARVRPIQAVQPLLSIVRRV